MVNSATESSPPTNERATIGARLREAREYLGLSQQDVAAVVGLPRTAVSMMESGQRGVDSLELKALAKLYQRPIAFLAGEEEAPASGIDPDVALLAKQVKKLSDQDRDELMRFSEFLMHRSQARSRDDNDAT
jgi:transcriptional regulator with XRE-family HTH domain